jgi:hypothetical protein
LPVRLPTAPSRPPEDDPVDDESSDDVELEVLFEESVDEEPRISPNAGRSPLELETEPLDELELSLLLPLLLLSPELVPSKSPTALPTPDNRPPLPESLDDEELD